MHSINCILLIAFMLAGCAPTVVHVPSPPATAMLTVTPVAAAIPTAFCQPPGYPGTIHYATGDNFGGGYIARVRMADVTNKSQEEIVINLVNQWLEHYKTQSKSPSAAIKDYVIDKIDLYDPSCDPFFEIVAGVRFSIIPNQIPNDYASFPGDPIATNDVWWHIAAPFGVFRDENYYRLRLVFGWGT